MEISIIIPSKDRKNILFESLQKAYEAIKGVRAEIIVINDSKTERITIPDAWADKVKVFDNPKSGVASARNLGASKAAADLLLFLDDDMWIAEENILITLALHEKFTKDCCINLNWIYPDALQEEINKTSFGRYLRHFGFDSMKGWSRGQAWDDHQIFECEGITSQYLSIRRADFMRSGGYNEGFPHAGFEDYEYGKRLREKGIQPYIYPLSMVRHNEADRMQVKPWLDRKRRGGETRQAAVQMGHSELVYHYGFFKSIVYRTLIPLQPAFQRLLSAFPNHKALDPIYFRLLNLMLGTALFEGYHKKISLQNLPR